MAIKMRTNKDEDAICESCSCDRNHALDMYDIMIGKTLFTVCDACNEELLRKTLTADCRTMGRLKSTHDSKIISARRAKVGFKTEKGTRHLSINEAMEDA